MPPSIEEVRRRLKNNSIFIRFAQKLRGYVLISESLARVVLDAVNSSKFKFEGAQTTAAFDGVTFYLPSSILMDDEIREVDISFLYMKWGIFIMEFLMLNHFTILMSMRLQGRRQKFMQTYLWH